MALIVNVLLSMKFIILWCFGPAKYKAANEAANNGKERKDLYSDAWDGDVYKGEPSVSLPRIEPQGNALQYGRKFRPMLHRGSQIPSHDFA